MIKRKKKLGELYIRIKTGGTTKEISVMKFDSDYVWDKTVLDTIDHYLKNDDIIEVRLQK